MAFEKQAVRGPDGRTLWLYAWERPLPQVIERDAPGSPKAEPAASLRWHPVLEQWIVVAPDRQERTFFPPDDHCPLCPTRDLSYPTEIAAKDFEVAVFENRFPSFSMQAPAIETAAEPYLTQRALGSAEVIVYSSEHAASLRAMPLSRTRQVLDVWRDRYAQLSERPEIEYVMIFENRGAEIGVTLTHPHGQVYAFPFVPPIPKRELEAAEAHWQRARTCLFCDVVVAEEQARERIVFGNDSVVAFVPYYARFPYEVHVVPRAHRSSLLGLEAAELDDLADALHALLQTYDRLWDRDMPFVMAMHQQPSDGLEYRGAHLHIEFTPPYRSASKLKFLAGSEMAAGVFINDVRPEEAAAELRAATPRI